MASRRTASSIKGILAGVALFVLSIVEETARNPVVRKGAMFACFAIIGAVLFVAWRARSNPRVDDDGDADDDDVDERASPTARFVWALVLSAAAIASFVFAEIFHAIMPPLQTPLRYVGALLLIVAAYKLFFGRKSRGRDVDWWY